ncbi:ribonuclease HII [bacterium]|nr:ribonuclease HII [bacterium]
MQEDKPQPTQRNRTGPLHPCYHPDGRWEIGVDEAGRGPLFGRLYVAATILPKDPSFRHDWMKDSKRFSSHKKIREVAEYIKSNAVAWTVRFCEAEVIDEINIRQAVLKTMRECCADLIERIKERGGDSMEGIRLLIDGNDFPAYTVFDPDTETLVEVESHTVEGGDNQYTCIAAASILAKVARDDWIDELCKEFPCLIEWYGIDRNKGYGTAEHMRGIRERGITNWHRRSYGPCKASTLVDVAFGKASTLVDVASGKAGVLTDVA